MSEGSLLPTRSRVAMDSAPAVVELTDADAIFEVLASETAREILEAIYEAPAPLSKIAETVETSVQNAGYHLERLERAGLVEVVDTWYSSKGNEMDVYGPSNRPLLIRAGDT